ncbi:replication initiation and membrane attachment family protein [Bacillus tianshenii]|nr:replication initiation and membrane attachment family protein [Bacillus tianshenii]
MTQHWKEVLPVDRYIVRKNGLLHAYDRNVVTLLYQPLIGAVATSLYMTLWTESDRLDGFTETVSHHRLMNSMQLNLQVIYNERLKLEGIGLLKTYVKKDEDNVRTFLYELQPPLTPSQFFYDGVLNVYLYNRIGKSAFHQLKQYFSEQAVEKEQYEDITGSFYETFSSVSASELTARSKEAFEHFKPETGEAYLEREKAKPVSIEERSFDFELFYNGLSKSMVPREVFTQDVKDVIVKLAFVYRISPLEMQKLVIQALNPATDEIEIDQLRKAARDWYQLEHGGDLPTLSERHQPIPTQTMRGKEPQTQEEQLVAHLENISPYECIYELSNGAVPSTEDLQLVEEVMLKQNLPAGVVNVLLQYVMLRSDMKLSKPYVRKIASHWARKNVRTVPEAMKIAKEEHQKYQEWEENKSKRSSSAPKRKFVRKEKLPDWFKKDETDEQSGQADESLDQMRKELEEELRKKRSER